MTIARSRRAICRRCNTQRATRTLHHRQPACRHDRRCEPRASRRSAASRLPRAGASRARAYRDRSRERRSSSRESATAASRKASTCSNLNFSLHAITGRQTTWSISTITAIIVLNPQTIARIVARIGRGLQIRAQAGQAKVAIPQHEHLARHQKEPAARHRHHGVPDQPDGGVGQLQLHELLPPAQAVHPRSLQHFARNILDGRVHAEGHVPHLPGEDQQDRPELHAQLRWTGISPPSQSITGGRKLSTGIDCSVSRSGIRNRLRLGIVGGDVRIDQREHRLRA